MKGKGGWLKVEWAEIRQIGENPTPCQNYCIINLPDKPSTLVSPPTIFCYHFQP